MQPKFFIAEGKARHPPPKVIDAIAKVEPRNEPSRMGPNHLSHKFLGVKSSKLSSKLELGLDCILFG